MTAENQIQETNTNLTMSDMVAIRQVIDTACTRGAFRGNEMAEVGALFNKLEEFINTIIQPVETTDQTQGESND
jgi:hypothetical protein